MRRMSRTQFEVLAYCVYDGPRPEHATTRTIDACVRRGWLRRDKRRRQETYRPTKAGHAAATKYWQTVLEMADASISDVGPSDALSRRTLPGSFGSRHG